MNFVAVSMAACRGLSRGACAPALAGRRTLVTAARAMPWSPLRVHSFAQVGRHTANRCVAPVTRGHISRSMCTAPKAVPKATGQQVGRASKKSTAVATSVVVEAAKTGGYSMVILFGVGLAGVMMYAVVSELLFSSGPTSVMNDSFRLIKQNERVCDILGAPLKAYGEKVGRRGTVLTHQEFKVGDDTFLRVKFYVEGENGRGTAMAEMRKGSYFGGHDYRFLVVEAQGLNLRPQQIMVVDNR